VPDLHRLHADDERMGEGGEEQERCGDAAGRRLPAHEVDGVGDACGGVEDEGKRVQLPVGP
jgi:hypothetical protein